MQGQMVSESNDDMSNDMPRYYSGNKPSTTILLRELTPQSLGSLIAFYEHKVFVQSVIWNINPFDQWGVERGKQIAAELLADLRKKTFNSNYDSSTKGLIESVNESAQ